jgi:hypothetical protein
MEFGAAGVKLRACCDVFGVNGLELGSLIFDLGIEAFADGAAWLKERTGPCIGGADLGAEKL